MLFRLLPALLPSWRFFDSIGPSPRIDYAWLGATDPLEDPQWQAFRPLPAQLSWWQFVRRLFWNPHWNETLFIVRCAERMLEGDTGFPEAEIQRRLQRAARSGELLPAAAAPHARLVFRIRAVMPDDTNAEGQVVFVSAPLPLGESASP
ncbi:MAG: hypothetical protein QE509_00650 [Gammaproteobacteria bacterium]|jgi:hypothetical protein|nr:hypothetical protein [Gammaproteobacteria bacterium]